LTSTSPGIDVYDDDEAVRPSVPTCKCVAPAHGHNFVTLIRADIRVGSDNDQSVETWRTVSFSVSMSP
jgi:hypothetical protein